MNDSRDVEAPGGDDRVRFDAVTLPWLFRILLRDRRLILSVGAAGFAIAVVLALSKSSTYLSTFSFIPQSGEDQGRSGLASLAGQFGLSVGGLGGSSQPPQLYADLLQTRGVLSAIARDSVAVDGQAKRIPVSEFLKIKDSDPAVVLENTIRVLRQGVVSTSVATHTTGVISASARTSSPKVSLQIAEKLLEGLNKFNVATRKSQAAEERRFTEARLAASKASLRTAEDALQSFLQANRRYEGAPELVFQKERLQREVNVQQQLVTGLTQQYEDARIREVRDTPVITVIEPPSLPVFPEPKGRLVLAIVLTFISLFMGSAFVVVREGWRRQQRTDSERHSHSDRVGEWPNAPGPTSGH